MNKTISIEFDELSKSITAKTKIVYEFGTADEIIENSKLLEEARNLFEQASAYTYLTTQKKSGGFKGGLVQQRK